MQQYILPYLAKHKKLEIAGLGVFYKNALEANWNFSEQVFDNPSDSLQFEHGATNTSDAFITYVASKENISESAAKYQILQLQNQSTIALLGIGKLEKDGNKYKLFTNQVAELHAIKAIKVNSIEPHYMQVGDYTVSVDKMNNILEDNYETVEKQDNKWYTIAWIIFILTIAYMGYYFYKYPNQY